MEIDILKEEVQQVRTKQAGRARISGENYISDMIQWWKYNLTPRTIQQLCTINNVFVCK
jgi:hypothetical protein